MAQKRVGLSVRPMDILVIGGALYAYWLWKNKDKLGLKWPWEAGGLLPNLFPKDPPPSEEITGSKKLNVWQPTTETVFIDNAIALPFGYYVARVLTEDGVALAKETVARGPSKYVTQYDKEDFYGYPEWYPVGNQKMIYKGKNEMAGWWVTESRPFSVTFQYFRDGEWKNVVETGKSYWVIKFAG